MFRENITGKGSFLAYERKFSPLPFPFYINASHPVFSMLEIFFNDFSAFRLPCPILCLSLRPLNELFIFKTDLL